ncbi:MAG TPA: hypothetical protein VKV05_01305 [Terriglobales bacterium]|nr:hypothetical protein [Terriglobales bacterium]
MQQAIFPLVVALLIGMVGGAALVNFLLGSRLRTLIQETTHGSELTKKDELITSVVPRDSHLPQAQLPVTAAAAAVVAGEPAPDESDITKSHPLEDSAVSDELASKGAEIARLQEELAAVQTKLAEASSELERVQEQCTRLEEQAAKVSSLENELAVLQSRAQEDSSARESALSEQAARLSELEQGRKSDSLEIERLNQEVTEWREKWQAAAAHVEEQQKALERLEAETAELSATRNQFLEREDGLRTKLAELNALLDAERQHTSDKLALLEQARAQLSNGFKHLTPEMVEEKTSPISQGAAVL